MFGGPRADVSSESVLHRCKTKLRAWSPNTFLHPLPTTFRTFLTFDQFSGKQHLNFRCQTNYRVIFSEFLGLLGRFLCVIATLACSADMLLNTVTQIYIYIYICWPTMLPIAFTQSLCMHACAPVLERLSWAVCIEAGSILVDIQSKRGEEVLNTMPSKPKAWVTFFCRSQLVFCYTQALTKGWLAPGVAGAFAGVFLLGGLGRGRWRGGMGVGDCGAKEEKRGSGGRGGGRCRNRQRYLQAIVVTRVPDTLGLFSATQSH